MRCTQVLSIDTYYLKEAVKSQAFIYGNDTSNMHSSTNRYVAVESPLFQSGYFEALALILQTVIAGVGQITPDSRYHFPLRMSSHLPVTSKTLVGFVTTTF